VSAYLENDACDRLLAVLPFSFDYGLSQLTTALLTGASVTLMDYLLPRDVLRMAAKDRITGLAAVPSLWNQLARLEWPPDAVESLRYITSSGGAMPVATTQALRETLPGTRIFLMYGLTEAFRSSYLAPEQVAARPDSIGKAVPNASLHVVRPDGSECGPDEPGELVHRGALVALGYWNDTEQTSVRFRPAPGQPPQLPNPELAVWSGDRVRRDADGYLYFLGRDDEMIKTSGYRVSPVEVEEPMFKLPKVEQAVAFGVPHPDIGSAIVVLLQARPGTVDVETADRHCREHLPAYLVPAHIEVVKVLPRNPNGKIDRRSLSVEYSGLFTDGPAES
jgi:acyl-CoA synthetase (AMP-forming)/AMP-acid ligase II